ncbi:hypothetical protein LCGC14_2099250, partial [marine sediment metagenome]
VEVLYPSPEDATYVSRAAGELAGRHGPAVIASLPLRRAGEVVAVLLVEREPDKGFTIEELESLRLTCDLCTPRLVDLYKNDRWVGARAAAGLRTGLAAVIGPKHTWWKVAAIAVCAILAFLIFFKGNYRADASFTLQAVQRQVIPAPFDGYLKTVHVRPGDSVVAGETVLATLDTAELREQLGSAKAERHRSLIQAAAAMAENKTVEEQIARTDADKADASIRLLERRINQARIVSEIAGIVIVGDLERQIGAPVKIGDILFEVAPLKELRAELSVTEDQIADVLKVADASDPEGELATAGYPDIRVGFVVERINPVAEVVDQKNVFKIRVRLAKVPSWMRPGMEGVAKINLGKRSYGYLLTRKLINWIRMKLWI